MHWTLESACAPACTIIAENLFRSDLSGLDRCAIEITAPGYWAMLLDGIRKGGNKATYCRTGAPKPGSQNRNAKLQYECRPKYCGS